MVNVKQCHHLVKQQTILNHNSNEYKKIVLNFMMTDVTNHISHKSSYEKSEEKKFQLLFICLQNGCKHIRGVSNRFFLFSTFRL